MLRFLFETNKVISCDIAELNPLFDRDGTTALLAARLVDFMAAIK
jgi:formiminoglutamase